jgi:hypothetical protein
VKTVSSDGVSGMEIWVKRRGEGAMEVYKEGFGEGLGRVASTSALEERFADDHISLLVRLEDEKRRVISEGKCGRRGAARGEGEGGEAAG